MTGQKYLLCFGALAEPQAELSRKIVCMAEIGASEGSRCKNKNLARAAHPVSVSQVL